MNVKLLKNISIGIACTIIFIYTIFLILPLIVSPILNNYIPTINDEIKKATGLVSQIENIKLSTTPKLGIGLKISKFSLLTPDKKEILISDNFGANMSILPILTKKIELASIFANNLDINLGLNKDGSFEIEKYLPAQTESLSQNDEKETTSSMELPFGLKLSNHMPNIKIKNYNINFIDISNGKNYLIKGEKTEITDFVLNKSIKINANGNMILAGREQFKYNLKIKNKIMPEIDLNDLVFNPEPQEEKNKQAIQINILDIFKGLYDYKITANIDSNLYLSKNSYKGYIKADNLSVSPNGLTIPPSNINLQFKGNNINIDSNLYTAQNEASVIKGKVSTGKKTKLDINVKSNTELSHLIQIVNAFAMTFNIKDLQTLSANGKINADFNIKSDLKNVTSNGYLKIPSAKICYGLYNITIDNIITDIVLSNNNIDIKNIGFSIFNQPLKLYGTIKQDATINLHLTGNDLSLKGLLIACGQANLLKENPINSGLISLKADILGKLNNIKPTAKIVLSNLNIKNIPSNTVVKLPLTDINITTDGKSFSGNAISTNIKAINPAATVSIPKISINIKENVIEIAQTPINIEKINLNVSGKIKDYLSENLSLDFVTTGDIKSSLTGEINSIKQTLNLIYHTTQNSTIVVPTLDKSKMTFNCNLSITGNMLNPQISGAFNAPSINLPEIPVQIENIVAKLHGNILNGNATIAKFTSGGITADAITTDFSMKGENLYLNNLKGNAFDGKFNGNIVYNMTNAKTNLIFKGDSMDAEKAIAGATGISNALSGILNFDTKMSLIVYPDLNEMMKSINGSLSFKIENGAFGKIGRLENLLQANNIIGNSLLKATTSSFSNIGAIKNSAQFDYLSGEMTFSNGWANILNIKSTGKSIAYFITGKYNLINGNANFNILGRLDGTIVKLLGPIGELSAEKILSYIPNFGNLTAKYANTMTTDPDKERVKDIPALSKSSTYKDFKVEFKGNIGNVSSVKSFKWLSKVDTSAIEQPSVKETVKSLKSNVSTDINTTVNTIKETKEQFKQSFTDIKNIFKN